MLMSCSLDVTTIPSQRIENGLQASETPFSTALKSVSFHPNIEYGDDERNVYDFFKPNLKTPSSLLILIHGGGFVNGGKANYYESYRYRGLINRLLKKNIAVAAINYRYLNPEDTLGILNSLNDAKQALQHLRYFSDSLHFQKDKVMIYGSSAGSAAAMWLGFGDERAKPKSENPIERESTRIQGLVGISTQANYDIATWHNTVFSSFQKDGFTEASLKKMIKEYRILVYYGIKTREELASERTKAYLNKTDMLSMLSADDPLFYLSTEETSGDIPTKMSDVFHHPLHVKTIQQRAVKVGAKGIYHCPQINLNTTKGESYEEFIIKTIGH
ncbi:MAG: alpha/beta hydrolase [Kordia sp.]|uniref:alpha/beta hydrolase n=1 Tax=Kordia sp. TaxID=1965332 RepID=UPI00385878F4